MELERSTSIVGAARLVEPSVSWSAVIAGAVTALAVSILLTILAAGFGYQISYGGLASHSFLTGFTPIIGAGAVAIQVVAAALGGYVAGRLREAWLYLHADEAHFRDTAHGLLAWALSTVVGVILAATVLTPYAERLAEPLILAAATSAAPTAVQLQRIADIQAQAAFFTALGMLLSAFTAAVAARVGGLRGEEMHGRLTA